MKPITYIITKPKVQQIAAILVVTLNSSFESCAGICLGLVELSLIIQTFTIASEAHDGKPFWFNITCFYKKFQISPFIYLFMATALY